MLDKKDLDTIRQRMEKFDNKREILIKKSRDVLKLSKQIIYSVHRSDIVKAGDLITEIKNKLHEMNKIVEENTKLIYSGTFKVTIQEYVEAICYYEFVKNKKIPSHLELGVGGEYYILGLCDLVGELVRKAITHGIESNMDEAMAIKNLVEEIYGELLKFDFKSGELRRKFDSIRYDLNKLEDLIFQLKLKER